MPKLHPVQDMGLKSDKVKHAMECLADIDAKLANNALMRQESNKEQQLLAKLQDLALERAQLQVLLSTLQLVPLRNVRKCIASQQLQKIATAAIRSCQLARCAMRLQRG